MTHTYTDKNADLVLQSKEGKEFRVHSYMLKANSDVFRSMLETCGSPLSTDKHEKPVPLDHTSDAVVDFLDLIYLGVIKGSCTWKRCETLLSIIDQYGAPKLGGLVTLRLFDVVGEAPWQVFAVASQVGNTALAKVAIAKFPPQLQDSVASPLWSVKTYGQSDWKPIAEYFTPL